MSKMAKPKAPQIPLDDATNIIEIGMRLGRKLEETLRFPADIRKIGELFGEMRDSRYRLSFEKVIQRVYQTPNSSPNWERAKDILERHMNEYGFAVPR